MTNKFVIDTSPALHAGLMDASFHLRRLRQWGGVYTKDQGTRYRYIVELDQHAARLRAWARVCLDLAEDCDRLARLLRQTDQNVQKELPEVVG